MVHRVFGKGTVQNAIDLNRFMNADPKLGQIKMTIAKFYRINGGSTQHIGVLPDITFPSRYMQMDIGEDSQPNALVWDQINPLKYNFYGDIEAYLPHLLARYHSRTSQNEEYLDLLSQMEKVRENHDRTQISLNEEKRRQEREQNKEDKEDVEQEEEEALEKENGQINDLMLTESGHILSDYIMLLKEQRTGKK